MSCLGLSTKKFMIHDKDSTSESIVVFFQTSKTARDVVLKISVEPTRSDNSLEVEREIYLHVKDTLSLWSPHFLAPLHVGRCSDADVVQMKTSHKLWERELFEEWALLRLLAIQRKLEESKESWQKLVDSLPKKVSRKSDVAIATYLLEKHPTWKTQFREMRFVMTPHLKGERLDDFLLRLKVVPPDIVKSIAIQLAQALAVLSVRRLMHNDVHFGNVYVETLDVVKRIPYDFPKKSVHKTRYQITVYDFDRAALEGGTRNKALDSKQFCKKFGECNEFVPKSDWYTVLTMLSYYTNNNPEIVSLMKGMYESADQASIGTDAIRGHSCTCQKLDPTKTHCLACVNKSLAELMTPRAYFLQNI